MSTSKSCYSGFVPLPLVIELGEETGSRSTGQTSKDSRRGRSSKEIKHYIWIKAHSSKSQGAPSAAAHETGKNVGVSTPASEAANALSAKLNSAENGDIDEYPAGRTLFVANLPVDFDVRSDTQKIFGEYGTLERVVLKENMHGSRSGRDTDGLNEGGLGGVGEWLDEEDDEDADSGDSDDGNESKVDSAEQEMDPVETQEGQQLEGPSTTQVQPKRRRNRRSQRGRQAKTPAPEIVPLPPLDPRPSSPILPTNSSAYIVFLDSVSIQRAIALAPSRKSIKITRQPHSDEAPLGIKYYQRLYDSLRPSIEDVQTHADSCMALFDHFMEAQKAKHSSAPIVDEDGFTLVVRGGRFGRTAGKGDKGVGIASRRFVLDSKRKVKALQKMEGDSSAAHDGLDIDAREGVQRGKKRKESAIGEGFYSFQRHEKRRQNLANLRAKFEADREKVARLKGQRRFTPY